MWINERHVKFCSKFMLKKKRQKGKFRLRLSGARRHLSRCVNKLATFSSWPARLFKTFFICVFKPVLMMRRWFSQHWRLRTGRNYFCCFVSPQKTTVSCPRRLSFIRMGWQSQRRAQGRRQVPCCQPHTVRKHRMDLKWKPIDLETYNFSYISQVYLSLRGFGRMREVLL